MTNNCQKSPEEKLKNEFDSQLRDHGQQLIAFILRNIQQHRLFSTEPYDVLNEVYLRGIKYTKSGKSIHNLIGWTKKTSLNVIREMSRKQVNRQKTSVDYNLFEYKIAALDAEAKLAQENKTNELIKRARKAFQELSDREQKILLLREIQELSWKKVGHKLALDGDKTQSDSTLRKQGQRAKEHLKSIYWSMYKEEEI
ncbi:MAG: sigma-70 family RNA polymerase sigma factor [Symploca sp. SIO1A3]|nr:sigma-70 family RNA polymerase sigma factor [Symploca sp. SIO1A3]